MNAGVGVSVLNPYEWLPPYGENAVIIESQGLDLVIRIEYDADDDATRTSYKELQFKMVCAFYRAAFPGVSMLDVNYSSNTMTPSLGALIEYPDSEVAIAWSNHFGNYRPVKHYKIIFLSENVLVEIFAGDVILNESPLTNQCID